MLQRCKCFDWSIIFFHLGHQWSGKAQQHFRPSSNTTCFPLAASLCRWLSPGQGVSLRVPWNAPRKTCGFSPIDCKCFNDLWVEYEWRYIDLIFRIFKLHTQRRHLPYLQRILETKRDLKDILKPSYSFGTWFFNFHPAFSCFKQLTPPPNLHENKPRENSLALPESLKISALETSILLVPPPDSVTSTNLVSEMDNSWFVCRDFQQKMEGWVMILDSGILVKVYWRWFISVVRLLCCIFPTHLVGCQIIEKHTPTQPATTIAIGYSPFLCDKSPGVWGILFLALQQSLWCGAIRSILSQAPRKGKTVNRTLGCSEKTQERRAEEGKTKKKWHSICIELMFEVFFTTFKTPLDFGPDSTSIFFNSNQHVFDCFLKKTNRFLGFQTGHMKLGSDGFTETFPRTSTRRSTA